MKSDMTEEDLIAKIKAGTKALNKTYYKSLTSKGMAGLSHQPRKRKIKRKKNA